MPPRSLTDLAGLGVSAEDFLAAVSETAAQPIWVVDPDDVIRFANPAAITALGYDSADELLGLHHHETIHYKYPDGTPYPAAECPMQLPRTTGQTVARDLDWFFRRDGSKLPVSYVSVPIGTAGRGAVVVFADIGDRLRAEHVLRERDAVLGAREDSLRRIAALVAAGAASADVFAAIAREVGVVVGLPLVVVWRYAPDGTTATVIGAWSEGPHPFQTGTRWLLDGPSVLTQVLKTGRPARIDDFSELPGTIADAARKTGLRAAAGAPIIVNGDLWGAMSGNAVRAPLPDHMEDRLAAFTELVATAISNAESRADLARLAEEQAALRRVATLVARGTRPQEVFAAVANEVGRLLSVDVARAWGSARPSAARSLSRAASGASSPPRLRARRRFLPTPSPRYPSSRSSWRPRSPTPKRGRRWRRHARGSWRRPTKSADVSFAICMTELSRGWSTRSSWWRRHSRRSNPTRSLRPRLWPRRSPRQRLRQKSSALSCTASFRRFSPTGGCARPSSRSPCGRQCRSMSPCPWAGSRPRSKQPHTSSSPKR